MIQSTQKYNFYKKLLLDFQNEVDFELEFPFISFTEYRNRLNHNKFVIYEDWWLAKPNIVSSKIKAKLGLSNRVFARKTEVKKITKPIADSFLNKHHIYGSTIAKHKLGLYYQEELIAVATFSMQRNLNVGRSVELIRFCSKNDTIVVGGLDKLLKFYEKEYLPDHIMSYVDKDWGNGASFINLGFKITSERNPIEFCVDIKTGERTLLKLDNNNCKLKVFNRGSMKLEKFC